MNIITEICNNSVTIVSIPNAYTLTYMHKMHKSIKQTKYSVENCPTLLVMEIK